MGLKRHPRWEQLQLFIRNLPGLSSWPWQVRVRFDWKSCRIYRTYVHYERIYMNSCTTIYIYIHICLQTYIIDAWCVHHKIYSTGWSCCVVLHNIAECLQTVSMICASHTLHNLYCVYLPNAMIYICQVCFFVSETDAPWVLPPDFRQNVLLRTYGLCEKTSLFTNVKGQLLDWSNMSHLV